MNGTVEELQKDNARLRQWLGLTVDERLVDLLAALPSTPMANGEAKVIRPPSQLELAREVGTRRETVNRVMRDLRVDGLITYGRMDPNAPQRPLTLILSAKLFERAGDIRSER